MARRFNGTTSSISVDSIAGLSFPCALSCWFRTTDDSSDQAILAVGDELGIGYFALVAAASVAGNPLRAISRGTIGLEQASTAAGFLVGQWHHALGVWTSNSRRQVWIDGSSGNGDEDTSLQLLPTLTKTALGLVPLLTPISRFVGDLAEAAIWQLSDWPGSTDDERVDNFVADMKGPLARGRRPLERVLGLLAYWPLYGMDNPELDRWGTEALDMLIEDVDSALHPGQVTVSQPILMST